MARKLNNDLRERTIATVLRNTFAQREAGLKAAIATFAGKAYLALVPAHFLAVVDSLPREWFMRSADIAITYTEPGKKGRSDHVYELANPLHVINERTRGDKRIFTMEVAAPFPYHLEVSYSGYGKLSLDGNVAAPSLRKEYAFLNATAEAIVKERDAARDRLRNLLASCNTVERLVEIAPELKPFIPAEAFVERAPMPAPIVGTLITDLMKAGLKVQEVEVAA